MSGINWTFLPLMGQVNLPALTERRDASRPCESYHKTSRPRASQTHAAKDGAQNDWSVCTKWFVVDGFYYLLDLTRVRCDYPRLRDTAIALAQRFKPNAVLIEDACTGSALASDLRPHLRSPVKLVPVDRDKKGRLYVQQAKFEAGRVLFPKGAAFLAELEAELLTFPQSRHDDQVDSISQALNYDVYDYTTAMMAAMSD